MDKEFNFSLCLALPNLSGTNSFYRIADYNPASREFSQAKYEYSRETPVQIYSSKTEGVANKVEIRKWRSLDEKKQLSYYEELRFGYVYEIIFLEELIHQPLNERQLRQVLYDGISLPDGIARYFLLVLDVTSESYRVLLCDRNAFKFENGKYYIEKQVRDLKNTTIEFDLMYIYNNQIISTEILRNTLKWYSPEKLRYFYNLVILPESTKKFQIRDPQDYTVGFFSNYLKNSEMRNKYSNQVRSNLMSELEYIEDNYTLVKRFFAVDDEKNIATSEIFIKNIKNIIDFIISSENTELETLLAILEKNPVISSEFEERIETKWMARFNQNILEKENELEAIEKQYDEKMKKLNNIIDDFNKAKISYQKIDKELSIIKERKTNIEKQINKELKNFQNNIVEQVKLSALTNDKQINNTNNSGMIVHSSRNLEIIELKNSENLTDILKGIKYNLENFMYEPSAESYAAIVIAVLFVNKLIILPEFHSEEIANAISLIVTGRSVKTINIINDNYDLASLIDQVNKNQDRYVLIKGHLDMFNESAVNTLINQSKKKNIFFTINDEKSLSLFSNNLWNYCVYLNPLDSFVMAIEQYWKKSNEVKVDIPKFNISTDSLPSGFYKRFTEETLFTQYGQEEFLYIMEVYTSLYKKIVDKNFEINSMENVPLSHQILAVNRNRISEIESYLDNIGIENDVMKFYK